MGFGAFNPVSTLACGLLTFQKQITCISRAVGAVREAAVVMLSLESLFVRAGGIRRHSICADAA